MEKRVYRLEEMIIAINRTKISVTLPDGQHLMEAIARRDMLKMRSLTIPIKMRKNKNGNYFRISLGRDNFKEILYVLEDYVVKL